MTRSWAPGSCPSPWASRWSAPLRPDGGPDCSGVLAGCHISAASRTSSGWWPSRPSCRSCPGDYSAALVGGARETGTTFFEALRTWWIADVVAVLVIAPPFLTPRRDWQGRFRRLRGWRAVEAVLAQATVILVVWGVYWHPRSPFRPSFYLLPCLLWVTFRFGSQGIMLALVSTAILTVRGTL